MGIYTLARSQKDSVWVFTHLQEAKKILFGHLHTCEKLKRFCLGIYTFARSQKDSVWGLTHLREAKKILFGHLHICEKQKRFAKINKQLNLSRIKYLRLQAQLTSLYKSRW